LNDFGDPPMLEKLIFAVFLTVLGVAVCTAQDKVRVDAEQGDADAQFWLGIRYRDGHGVPKDLVEAAKWYRKAADQGYAEAQQALGNAYLYGEGVSKDPVEAVKWYRKSAEQGVSAAQEDVGQSYYFGEGVPKDYAEAVRWYRRAANQGSMGAQYYLGFMYANGLGVPQDFIEAYKWFNLAGACNYPVGISCAESFVREIAQNRDLISERMTANQIAEAQRRSETFVPRRETESMDSKRGINLPATPALPKASGSGFFVTPEGHFLTNYHVIEDAIRIVIQTPKGTLPAKLIKADKVNDLALLKISGVSRPIPLAPSRGVRLGDGVFTIGFPNIQVQGIEPKLTRGEINSLSGIQDDPRYFQISTSVQPGNSGGPLRRSIWQCCGNCDAPSGRFENFDTHGFATAECELRAQKLLCYSIFGDSARGCDETQCTPSIHKP
jgi:hypothetical protein